MQDLYDMEVDGNVLIYFDRNTNHVAIDLSIIFFLPKHFAISGFTSFAD